MRELDDIEQQLLNGKRRLVVLGYYVERTTDPAQLATLTEELRAATESIDEAIRDFKVAKHLLQRKMTE